jgi:hypothetical protein
MPPLKKKRVATAPSRVALVIRPESERGSSTRGLSGRLTVAVYALTIFLSAFLLFQVQLILGKFVLPRFGGSPSVWSTSLLIFQFLLLAGYGYAAFLTQRFAPRSQGRIHLGLLTVSVLAVAAAALEWHSPILPLGTAAPSADGSPVLQIAVLLLTAVGLPCLLLSSSSPLLQKWFSDQNAGASPYRLYALSNLGSMLGLLSYPFAIEMILRLSAQAWLWAVFYLAFLANSALCVWSQQKHARLAPLALPARRTKNKTGLRLRLVWLTYSACGSVMLLATTNLICQEVAVIPLLWVLPLSLYLLSFIICFDHARWYRREIFHPLYLTLALLSLGTLPVFPDMTIGWPLAIFCATLFAVCMVCHGELARLKPEPQQLTGFYLMISAGGVLGSAFVVLVAPHVFTRFWEFQIALIGCGVLLGILLVRDPDSWVRKFRFGWLVLAGSALVFAIGAWFYTDQLRNREGEGDFVVWRARNFFGMKTVVRLEPGLYLLHGRTLHGMQNADPALRDEPTSYYSRSSGIGLLLENHIRRVLGAPLRIGVIGMGAGTLAAYGRSGDSIKFYELDPDIVRLSQGGSPLFTFVRDSPAPLQVATGDARILLQQELTRNERQNFDVLAVDAFSGDAVPVHLLTREALAIYLQHLRGPRSVIAFHVTNRSIDLRPVVAALAQEYHLASLEIHPPEVGDWILLSADSSVLEIPALAAAGHPIELTRPPLLWTDDYSNLYSLLRSW